MWTTKRYTGRITILEEEKVGTVVRIHSNYYYIDCENIIWECMLRNKRKKEGIEPKVGDRVVISEFKIVTEDDIINIALTHHGSIQSKLQIANKLLFCDTDVITTQIYSQHYLGVIPPILYEIENKTSYDLYFLMNIDTPWIADPLRDLGERRDEMMNIFKTELDKRNIPYIPIQGNYEQREKLVVEAINSLLQRF